MDEKFSVHLTYVKPFNEKLSNNIDNINDSVHPEYIPLDLSNINYYYPILDLFNNDSLMSNQQYSLFTNRQIIDYKTVYNNSTELNEPADIFFKFAPLLDPTRYMIGKYNDFSNNITNLPKVNDNNSLEKYRSIHNASYIDNFACFLLGKLLNQHKFIHGLEYYGSFLSIQNKYKIDVVDELEYLYESDFFKNNINKLFYIDDQNNDPMSFLNYGSRCNKPTLNISDDHHNITIANIDNDPELTAFDDIDYNNDEIVYENKKIDISNNHIIDLKNDENSDQDNTDDDDENSDEDNTDEDVDDDDEYEDVDDEDEYEDVDDDDDDENSDEDDKPIFAFIHNFPVQTICIEKCHGTFDKLLENDDINIDTGRSILFQIIMILITLQKCFHLTHNDLHTNNVMFINTDIEFLYYRFNKKCYKVPTYGKLVKIIDYGRSIFKYNGHLFCSDSYSPGGDAHTQYNTEPFFNNQKPRLEPNYSFDLCRLGCSIYDFIIDDDIEYSELDDFQKIISDWCTDDNKKNILYKKNGEERYPNFKLYKMIARTVHKHTPEEQLKNPYFSIYETDKFENGIDIDIIPTYY